jgi:hypothetical protein
MDPEETLKTVAPRFKVPPLSTSTLAFAPFKFKTPPLTVPRVATPPAVNQPLLKKLAPTESATPITPPLPFVLASAFAFTMPPLISELSLPETFTVP